MENINIEATDETPKVIFNREEGLFEMSGKSLPEDVTIFYNPILTWLDGYALDPNAKTKFAFKMDYFNTASSKLILDILLKLEEINQKSGGIEIVWYYREGDEDIEESGDEYSELVEIPFKIKEY